MEDGEAEVEEARRDRLAVDEHVPLDEVPAARARDEDGGLFVQPVGLLAGVQLDRAAHGIGEVALALDDVLPRRRARVLEVGHEDPGARVHGVDHHLAVDGACDLDAPVPEIGRRRRHLPVGVANGQQLGQGAGVELGLPLAASLEELEPRRVQLAVELGDELERFRAENVRVCGGEELEGAQDRVNWASSVEPESASVELSPSAWSSASK